MSRSRSRFLVRIIPPILVCELVLGMVMVITVQADSPPGWPAGCTDEQLGGQLIRICLPATPDVWNGHLVVYAHGYVPPHEPIALPEEELALITLPDGRTLVDVVVELGFAFATSSYSTNGYAVEQASQDLNTLVDHFKSLVPLEQLQKVLIVGGSEGGLVTVQQVEKFPEVYHGGLAMCGPLGGAPAQLKYVADFRIVFDYYFPDVFDFGAVDVPPDAYQDWEDIYIPEIGQVILNNPDNALQLFKVTHGAIDLQNPGSTMIATTIQTLSYSIWETNHLVQIAGGMPYDNKFKWYRGSDDDLALNAGVERVESSPEAKQYLRQFYQTTGNLQRPLVTLHTTQDPAVPFWHEAIYSLLATRADSRDKVIILPVARYGHCTFTPQEVLGAFALLLLKSHMPEADDLKSYLTTLPPPAP